MMRFFLLIFLLPALSLGAWAQTAPPLAPIAVRPLSSISPDDTTFAELAFLRDEIGGARVVFLGEPTHGEGNVWQAQARLMEFLQDRMGFTTLGFESGFFDLHKAQRRIQDSTAARKALLNSVFPVWNTTEEFVDVRTLAGRDELRVMGFDPQIGTDYGDDLTDDLEEFLAPAAQADSLDYDLLYDLIGYMSDHQNFAPSHTLAELERELGKADQLLLTIAAGPDAPRAAEARFWQQCLRSVRALARDYLAHPLETQNEPGHQAHDSNARDAQMAENLLWYLREHPQEKVICWGALPHFANRVEMLENEELRTFHPMGRALKAALGARQVYIMGTLTSGGTCGAAGTTAPEPVPPPAAGSLEADLRAQHVPFAFVSLRRDVPGRSLTASAFDYQPIMGEWREVVDGFLFVREVQPPHLSTLAEIALADAPPADSAARAKGPAVPLLAAAPLPGSLNPLASRTGPTLRLAPEPGPYRRPVQGVVLDARTHAPVPYAAVALPSQGAGAVADAQGQFRLRLCGRALLQISSLGYAPVLVPAPFGEDVLTVELVPVSYALGSGAVSAIDPVGVLAKVVKALPTNYEPAEYSAQVYTHRRVSNFDTLRYEGEYLSQTWQPAPPPGGLFGWLKRPLPARQQVQAAQVLAGASTDARWTGPGFDATEAEVVRQSPLFHKKAPRHFLLHLDSVRRQGPDTLLIISFAQRPTKTLRAGITLNPAYTGRITVQKSNYAVLRYEALRQADTVALNALSRHYARKPGRMAFFYRNRYADFRSTHTVQYEKGAAGRYRVRTSRGEAVVVSRQLGRPLTHFRYACAEYFTPLPAGTPPLPTTVPPLRSELEQVWQAPYQPAFWDTFQRPVPGLVAPLPTGDQ